MDIRILVGVDGSDYSIQALKESIRFANASQGKLYLLNVQPSFHTIHNKLFIDEEQIKEYQQELFEDATKQAVELMKTIKVPYELIMKIGDPTQQICHTAKELNVDYIVVGSRGLGVFKGTVLGSVSNGILHKTEIPILIVPTH
ncbi:universal stress protein [Neobacillus sp. LXY-1]|uniref:universal stress protein n=1 Tax=Neobacillus sp. LXY-1 TaxID=3379133 RepID=UPI003EE208CA